MVGESASVVSVLLTGLKWLGWGLLGVFGFFLIGLLAIPPLTRGFTDKWGATPEEVARAFPGDDLFEAKREVSTRAVSIDAPPDLVYSLVVQIGQHRAGWYGWDWFYDLTNSSDFVDGHYSRRVVPELQDLEAGDGIAINDAVTYKVIEAERPHHLVLYIGPTDPTDMAGGTWSANSMAFVIEPLPDNGSRLLLRMRADGTEKSLARWFWNGPMNFGSALFAHKTIVGIGRTAEQIAGR